MPDIRQNLVFAFIYNATGVPIAAGLLYHWFGIQLSPIFAAAMHCRQLAWLLRRSGYRLAGLPTFDNRLMRDSKSSGSYNNQ